MIIEHCYFDSVKDTIIKLDKKSYKEFDLDEKWYSRYSDTKGKVIVAKDKDNKVIGYLCYSYITKSCFDMLKLGLLTSDYCLSNNCYCKNSKQVYLASIVVNKKYRKQGIATELYKEFLSKIGNISYIVLFGNKLKNSSFTENLTRKGVPDSKYDIFYNEVK